MSVLKGMVAGLVFGKRVLLDGVEPERAKEETRMIMNELEPVIAPAAEAIDDIQRKRAIARQGREARAAAKTAPRPPGPASAADVIDVEGQDVTDGPGPTPAKGPSKERKPPRPKTAIQKRRR